jgi:NAD-dependent deacetylase
VLEFYNIRRKQLLEVEPNAAHRALVHLEEKYDVRIVTQNVDELHERAGSKNVLHIHGELRKARSTADPSLIYDIDGWELKWGDKCEKGSQLRPHVVWFGEPVELMPRAEELMRQADILMVIGTSLVVYPAAGLIFDVEAGVPKYYVDPNAGNIGGIKNLTPVAGKAAEVLPGLVERLLMEQP